MTTTDDEETSNSLGVTAEVARKGPPIAIAGLVLWVATIVAFVILAPPDRPLATVPTREDQIRIIISMTIGCVGVFVAMCLSTIGGLLSIADRKFRPGPWPKVGVATGWIGASMLLLVLVLLLVRIAA
jgi:hypothetical protein